MHACAFSQWTVGSVTLRQVAELDLAVTPFCGVGKVISTLEDKDSLWEECDSKGLRASGLLFFRQNAHQQ